MSDNYDAIPPRVMERVKTLPEIGSVVKAIGIAYSRSGADPVLVEKAIYVMLATAYILGQDDVLKELLVE